MILCCAQSLNVGLGWVVFKVVDVGWVGLGQASSGLGWVGSRYLDPWPSLIQNRNISGNSLSVEQ